MSKIGFLITTFMRDNLLLTVLANCASYSNIEVIVVDQCPTEEKKSLIKNYVEVPYNCGLSYARNRGVEKAKELGCDFVLLMADSILPLFTMPELNKVIDLMNDKQYDIIGLPLLGRIGWECWMTLVPGKHFLLNFIKKQKSNDLIIQPCDMCRNFFIARIDVLLQNLWDEKFLMREHEDFFWRCKQNNVKVGFVNHCVGEYIGEKPQEYNRCRDANMLNGFKTLQEKYGISGWVAYEHLEYAKELDT